jgi:4-hydroxybenzoate polyprenyltransferase
VDVRQLDGDASRPAVLLARVTSVRFAAYYGMSLAAGLGAHRLAHPGRLLFVVGYCLAFCVAIESLNRVTDRTEDEVNQARRTAMCHQLGYGRLRATAVAAWSAVVLLDVAWVLARPDGRLAALLAVNLLIGIGYSAGPRLKVRRAAVLLVLTGAIGLPLLTGYLTFPDRDRAAAVATAGVLLVLLSLTTAGAKDVTDETGDRAGDYRSLWLEVVRRRRGLLVVLLGLQLLVPVAVVAAGTLPPAALLAVLVLPAEAAVLACVARARTAEERSAAREAMHSSTAAGTGVILLATQPSLPTAAAVAAGLAWWVAASRWLHWNRHLSARSLALCGALLRRAPAGRPAPASSVPTREVR